MWQTPPGPVLAANGNRGAGDERPQGWERSGWSRAVKSEQMATLALQKSSLSLPPLITGPPSSLSLSNFLSEPLTAAPGEIVLPGREERSPQLLFITHEHRLPLSSEAIS